MLGCFDGGRAPQAEDADGQVHVRFQDISGFDSNRIAETVETVRAETNAARHGDWKPWFPVIDYDRCTNCMQCLSFCLFGVYGVDEQQRIQVQNNDNCKTNCPACSRVCPEAAIMFPKYKAGPINGDLVSDADLQREKMKIDISALLGGDVYAMLRERSEKAKSRFSKERGQSAAGTPEVPGQTRQRRRHSAGSVDVVAFAGGNCAEGRRSKSQGPGGARKSKDNFVRSSDLIWNSQSIIPFGIFHTTQSQ